MGGDLLIFPETEEDSKKIYESIKKKIGTSGTFRQPLKNSAAAKVEDSLSIVAPSWRDKV